MYPDLIHSCYKNPGKGTQTLYTLALDLDAHRAGEQWKTKSGLMSWPRIKKFLKNEHPEIFAYIFSVVRSTGGRGLALYFAISPLELVPRTLRAQRSARALTELLTVFFNQHGLGADPAAAGLSRDFCNWQNPDRCLYDNIITLRLVQSARIPVVRNLLRSLKTLGLSSYIRKSERRDLLYPDKRVEAKLAVLYKELSEHWIRQDPTIYRSVSGLCKSLKLSRPFIEKFLKNPPFWLHAEYCGPAEGWTLTLKPYPQLTQRANELTLNQHPQSPSGNLKKLIRPEGVKDGFRNQWITRACLLLKHSGID